MDANKLLSADGIEERAEYYSKWGADIRAMNGASVDADHSEQTAFVLRALLANAQAQAASISALTKQVEEARDELHTITFISDPHEISERIAALHKRLSRASDAENSGSANATGDHE